MNRLKSATCLLALALVAFPSSESGNAWGIGRRQTTTTTTDQPLPADLDTSPNAQISTTDSSDIRPNSTDNLPIESESTLPNGQSTVPIDLITSNQPSIDIESTPVFETESPVEPSVQPDGSRVTIPQQPQNNKPVNFDCKRKDDGYYADPKDKCSSRFYACVGGKPRQLDCAAGLVYEPESNACERRQDSYRCSGVRKTTVPTTPRGSPRPASQIGIDCSKLEDGWYADPKKACSHVFFACASGSGSRFECPANSYFDKNSTSCKQYDEIFVCSGKQPSPNPVKPTTPLPKSQLPIDCENSPSGVYADPKNKCSKIYYVCSNGNGYKQTCPADTFFDPKDLLCDYPDVFFACSGKTKKPNNGTVSPIPAISSLPANEFNCTGKQDKAYLPSSQKCSKIYYRCFSGFAYKLSCPENLYFDLEHDMCETHRNVQGCSGKRRTTKLPQKPIPAEKVPIDCSKLKDGDHADPTKKCSTVYYSCSNAVGVRRDCPSGTYFDKVYKVCDTKEYVPECGGKPRPVTPKPTTRFPITKSPYNCPKKDGNYATGKCASRYFACVGGLAITSDCPAGTFYDTEKDHCGYKEEIPACGGIRPTVPVEPAELTSRRPPKY